MEGQVMHSNSLNEQLLYTQLLQNVKLNDFKMYSYVRNIDVDLSDLSFIRKVGFN